jgi:hypothetical protein
MSRSTVPIRRGDLRGDAAERGAAIERPAADHDEIPGTAREPSRRTLPWEPIVAMWCRPQPFGQPLIWMRRVGRDQIRARAQGSSSRRPRPRDCVTARRQVSAPGQLATSAMVPARRGRARCEAPHNCRTSQTFTHRNSRS